MEYDKEFEAWCVEESKKDGYGNIKEVSYAAWKAARKDHYRIGEEVESLDGEYKAVIMAVIDYEGIHKIGADNVRRIPAWTPKDGDAVLFENTFSYAECGLVIKVANCFVTVKTSNGTVFGDDAKYLRPFSADKIGKPWEEI